MWTPLCKSVWNLVLKPGSCFILSLFCLFVFSWLFCPNFSFSSDVSSGLWSSRFDIVSEAGHSFTSDSPRAVAAIRHLIWGQRKGKWNLCWSLVWGRVCQEVHFGERISFQGTRVLGLLVPVRWPESPPAHWILEAGVFPFGLYLWFLQAEHELVSLVIQVSFDFLSLGNLDCSELYFTL